MSGYQGVGLEMAFISGNMAGRPFEPPNNQPLVSKIVWQVHFKL